MKVMVIVKATKESEAGVLPSTELLANMGKFNEELVKAGIMLAGDGLKPSSKGKRVRFSGTKRIVTDGPFTETKELVAGYWIWQVRSMDEAIEWIKRAPFEANEEVEIRPFYEPEDFGENFTPRTPQTRTTPGRHPRQKEAVSSHLPLLPYVDSYKATLQRCQKSELWSASYQGTALAVPNQTQTNSGL